MWGRLHSEARSLRCAVLRTAPVGMTGGEIILSFKCDPSTALGTRFLVGIEIASACSAGLAMTLNRKMVCGAHPTFSNDYR